MVYYLLKSKSMMNTGIQLTDCHGHNTPKGYYCFHKSDSLHATVNQDPPVGQDMEVGDCWGLVGLVHCIFRC